MVYFVCFFIGICVILIRTFPIFLEMEIHPTHNSLHVAFQKELDNKNEEYLELKSRFDDLSSRLQLEKRISYEAGYNKAIYQMHNLPIDKKISTNLENRC